MVSRRKPHQAELSPGTRMAMTARAVHRQAKGTVTRKQLDRRVWTVVAILVIVGVLAVLLRLGLMPILSARQERKFYGLGKDTFPLLVAVLATFLASWFQQRTAFVESLRRLWSHL